MPNSTYVVVLDGYLVIIYFDEAMGSATDVWDRNNISLFVSSDFRSSFA